MPSKKYLFQFNSLNCFIMLHAILKMCEAIHVISFRIALLIKPGKNLGKKWQHFLDAAHFKL